MARSPVFFTKRVLIAAAAAMVAGVVMSSGAAQSDESLVLQFQRAADSYAFMHRQAERRGERGAMLAEGAIFTPLVADVLRRRIAEAARKSGCTLDADPTSFVVPHMNGPTSGTKALPACFAAVLPRLPEELEYRVAGVVLVLGDAHLHIVVDLLHGAFPVSPN